MLGARGLIAADEVTTLLAGLERIRREWRDGSLVLDPSLEDVHMNIEARLAELVGPVAGRMHMGRSRNDQVAVDSKIWARDAVARCDALLAELVDAAVARSQEVADAPMPGFTHLQCAQPVTLGHHLLAYGEMFLRDRDRLDRKSTRLNFSHVSESRMPSSA